MCCNRSLVRRLASLEDMLSASLKLEQKAGVPQHGRFMQVYADVASVYILIYIYTHTVSLSHTHTKKISCRAFYRTKFYVAAVSREPRRGVRE
jgi:hypothetical protein